MQQSLLFDEGAEKGSDDSKHRRVMSSIRLPHFPTTRYQGSKRKILSELATALNTVQFQSALDLYSGSGVVSLLLRYLGKRVDANDYQSYATTVARLFLSLTGEEIELEDLSTSLSTLLTKSPLKTPEVVTTNYSGIYFTDEENQQIDRFCQNIALVPEPKRSLLIYAVGQALLKKRPYNLFHRANLHMRTKDVPRSFGNAVTWETPIYDHAMKSLLELKKFPFGDLDAKGKSTSINTENLEVLPTEYDLIYLDPPYLNSKGMAIDYSDFYNFLEGLCDYGLYAKGDIKYPHRPIGKKPSNWASVDGAIEELRRICSHWPKSIVFLSYRSDGQLSTELAVQALSGNRRAVEIHTCGEYKYALSRTGSNEELFLISRP